MAFHEGTHLVVMMTLPIFPKGSDWITPVYANPFPLNSRAAIVSANFISDGKVQVSPYGVASSYILMMEPAQLMGALLFKTNWWAQSSLYPFRPFLIRYANLEVSDMQCHMWQY